MFTSLDKAIAAFLAPLVVAGLQRLGELTGVGTPVEVLDWAQAIVVSGVSALWVYWQRNRKG